MSRIRKLLDQINQAPNPRRSGVAGRVRARGGRPVLALGGKARSELDALVDRLYLLPDSPVPQICLFTALEARSGCSWVCAHASDLLASKVAASVCLVDMNVRAPVLHQRLGFPNHQGLTDLVSDPALEMSKIVAQVPGGDLWLLPWGSPVADHESLVRSEQMRHRVSELRSAFTFIVLDAPPVSACRETVALGELADGAVLILRAHTRREAALRGKERLSSGGVRIFGAVLNGSASPVPEAIYKRL